MKNKLILVALVIVPSLLFSCKGALEKPPKETPIDSAKGKIDTTSVKNVSKDSLKMQ